MSTLNVDLFRRGRNGIDTNSELNFMLWFPIWWALEVIYKMGFNPELVLELNEF